MPIVSSGVRLTYDNGVTRLLPSDLYKGGGEDSFGSKAAVFSCLSDACRGSWPSPDAALAHALGPAWGLLRSRAEMTRV